MGNSLRVGINFEAGYFHVAYKQDSKIPGGNDVDRWAKFYKAESLTKTGKDKALSGGSTLYAVYVIGDGGGLGIRPFIHWQWTSADFSNYEFFLNHAGLTLLWQLGGTK